MEAKELRIGNIVYFGIVKEPIKITGGIDEKNTTILMAEPIPLTEEWLIKFGLADKFYFAGDLTLDEEDSVYYLACLNGIGFSLPEIKYVHQLQNLYFALTGEELEIKN